jgi:uncharacterized membrane protein YsdA (DUF1294 family)
MIVKVILIYYLIFSAVSALMHLVDKQRAINNRRRIPEKTLHSMELIGGWPGAILITRAIRHKTSKPRYMWTLYAIATLHVLGWMLLLYLGTRS